MAASQGRGPVRALIFIAMAVALGSVALIGLYRLVVTYQERIDEAKRPEDTVMVIVAARDLYQGVTITEEDLYAVQIPPRFLPEGVFLSPEHVIGRIPRERILANEFVRADRLADPESGVGLNAVIPRGMRAISVEIQDGAALSGFLNPGNYVDVLVTVTPDEKDKKPDEGPETKTLLQAVFVLGVNSRAQHDTEEAREMRGTQRPSVTLLVNAAEAEQVAHAENVGDIRLSLRNDLDVNLAENLKGVDVAELRGKLKTQEPLKRATVKKAAAPEKKCMELEVVEGGTKRTKLIDPVTGLDCQ